MNVKIVSLFSLGISLICSNQIIASAYLTPHGNTVTYNTTASGGHSESITFGSGNKYLQFPNNQTILITETPTTYGSTTSISGTQGNTITKTVGTASDPNSISYTATGPYIEENYTYQGVSYPVFYNGPNVKAGYDPSQGTWDIDGKLGTITYNPETGEGSIFYVRPDYPAYDAAGTFQYEGQGQGSLSLSGSRYPSVYTIDYNGSEPDKLQVNWQEYDGTTGYLYSTGYDPLSGTITYTYYFPYAGYYGIPQTGTLTASYNAATETVQYIFSP